MIKGDEFYKELSAMYGTMGRILLGAKKPPLGIIPAFIHHEKRLKDITDAIARYNEAKVEVPIGWLFERDKLIDLMADSREAKV